MKISYDKQADVLYVWFAIVDPPYINLENEQGDVIRIVEKDGTIAGLILYDAMFRLKGNKTIEIPEVGNILLNEVARALLNTSEQDHAAV